MQNENHNEILNEDFKMVQQNVSEFQDDFKLSKSGFDTTMPGHTTNHPQNMVLRQEPREETVGITLPRSLSLVTSKIKPI
ncbi:hypothetical protein JMM81_19610 [Bacillus sp. V3B]|uniref:hypothetical protein n=1 Tax=Bacillus sp. V3B TaxID=2804915 RepID=UPI00210F06E1|nr:hypothetical protein [Bacillus sp. V3B]MCQ6277085.1 hypothetical protein [Bacillus sp. V3B]